MLEDVFKLTEKSMTVFSKHEAVTKSCVYGELFYCFTTFSLGVGMGEGEESPNIYIDLTDETLALCWWCLETLILEVGFRAQTQVSQCLSCGH